MPLDCWQVLAIAPTDDESAIKRAYAAKLKDNKPDKNPEGFRELRAAYEEALAIRLYFAEFEEESEDSGYDDSGCEDNVYEDNGHEGSGYGDYDNDDKGQDDRAQSANKGPDTKDTELNIQIQANQHHEAEPVTSFDIALQNSDAPYTALVIEDSLDLEDNWQLADSREITHRLETIPYWQQQWRQYDNMTIGNSQSSADSQLTAVLQSQLDEINSLSLDAQNEFEEQLLIWLAEQPLQYPQSYQLAKASFKWAERLELWDEAMYPWFLLRALDSRYEQLLNFGTQVGFRRYLAVHYPLVYQHWELDAAESDKGRPMSRWQFFRRFFIPCTALMLAQQLDELHAELEMVSGSFEHSGLSGDTLTELDLSAAAPMQNGQSPSNPAEYWQYHPQLQTLRRWVMQRFIGWQDYLYLAAAIALVVAVMWGVDKLWLMNSHSWQYFVYDGLGVWIILSMLMTVWQWLLQLYARPQRFVIQSRTQASNVIWCAISATLWALFSSIWFESAASNHVGAPHELSFYVAHLSAASLMLALTRRQDRLLLIHLMWYWLLMLLCLSVIAPLLVVFSHNPALIDQGLVFYGPLCWLVVIIPLWLLELSYVDGTNDLPFGLSRVIATIGEWLASLFILALLLASYLLWTFLGNILTTLNLGWSYIALIVLILTLGLILNRTIQAFDEMS